MFSLIKKASTEYGKFKDPNSILIYQMGKVGSSSLEKSLPNSLHLHTLYGNSPCYVYEEQRTKKFFKKIKVNVGYFVRRLGLSKNKEVKIISVVREPIARSYSMYFQDLPHWLYSYIGSGPVDTRGDGNSILHHAFEAAFDHDYYNEWFDKEIKKLTGIDIFKSKFDSERGISVLERGKFKLLLVKAEMLNEQSIVNEISDFCGKTIKLNNTNESHNKWYGSVYQKFKKEYYINTELLDNYLNSKTTNHFYNEDEIIVIRSKYERK